MGAGLRSLSVSFADNSSTALRFGNRPSLPSGQSMTGPKRAYQESLILISPLDGGGGEFVVVCMNGEVGVFYVGVADDLT